MSNVVRNLKARISRFNKANPALAIPSPPSSALRTAREFNAASRRLAKAQKTAKFHRAKNNLISAALEYNVKINVSRIRGQRTLAQAKAKVDAARRYAKRQEKFIERVSKYNRAVHTGEMNTPITNKFYQKPRSPKELTHFNRVLSRLEKNDVESARKMLSLKEGEEINATTRRRDRAAADKDGQGTFSDQQYFNIAIEQVGLSRFPELQILFRQLGVMGVNELSNNNFSVANFSESNQRSEPYNKEQIRDHLEQISSMLSPEHRVKVLTFIMRH